MPILRASPISSIAKIWGLTAGKDMPKISTGGEHEKGDRLSKFSTTAGFVVPPAARWWKCYSD